MSDYDQQTPTKTIYKAYGTVNNEYLKFNRNRDYLE
jgi:hypothetical protein